jgi:hypothetical protein
MLGKDAVTSPLQAPFTRFRAPAGAGELHEDVRTDEGLTRHAVWELVSCPFCLAVWVATALTGGLVLAPVSPGWPPIVLTAVTASDFLRIAHAADHAPGRSADPGLRDGPVSAIAIAEVTVRRQGSQSSVNDSREVASVLRAPACQSPKVFWTSRAGAART